MSTGPKNPGGVLLTTDRPLPAPPQDGPERDVRYTAENRFDIRPAVSAIMAAENWILDKLPAGQKVVIILGEIHDYQVHKLFQRGLLYAHHLQAQKNPDRRFAFGFEGPHNIRHADGLRQFFAGALRKLFPDDPDGLHSIRVLSKSKSRHHAMDGVLDVFSLCRALKISVSFNDVGVRLQKGYLHFDERDPDTKDLIRRHAPLLAGKPVSRTMNEAGMRLSNLSIVERSLAHMERTNSQIYIQHCGTHHVVGCNDGTANFKDSLTVLYKERGINVLPVLPAFEHMGKIVPDDAASVLRECVKIYNMADGPEYMYTYPDVQRVVYPASNCEL